jgi:Na+-driven multidrug efflux pump
MIINSLAFWGVMIPVAYILAFVLNWGIKGIMIAVVIGILVCAIAMFIRYRYTMRRIVREKRYLY